MDWQPPTLEALYRARAGVVMAMLAKLGSPPGERGDDAAAVWAVVVLRYGGCQFPREQALLAWLFGIARLTVLERSRRESRRRRQRERVVASGSCRARDGEREPVDPEVVREVLGSMSDGEREVMQLRYGCGATVAGAAAGLGVPLATVQSRRDRAVRGLSCDTRLRRALGLTGAVVAAIDGAST